MNECVKWNDGSTNDGVCNVQDKIAYDRSGVYWKWRTTLVIIFGSNVGFFILRATVLNIHTIKLSKKLRLANMMQYEFEYCARKIEFVIYIDFLMLLILTLVGIIAAIQVNLISIVSFAFGFTIILSIWNAVGLLMALRIEDVYADATQVANTGIVSI